MPIVAGGIRPGLCYSVTSSAPHATSVSGLQTTDLGLCPCRSIKACSACGSASADDYAKFKLIFADVRRHLKTVPGFLHLTWWIHPQDPTWHNEVSFWTSFEALKDWHMNTFHKHAKAWAVRSGAIMESIITNFELTSTRLFARLSLLRQGDRQIVLAAPGASGPGRTLSAVRLSLSHDRRNAR